MYVVRCLSYWIWSDVFTKIRLELQVLERKATEVK